MVNLSESIAVTQNFVPPSHLQSVLRFLKDKQEQVSGFKDGVDAYQLFRERLRAENTTLLEKAEEEMKETKLKKRKWVEETENSEFRFDLFA